MIKNKWKQFRKGFMKCHKKRLANPNECYKYYLYDDMQFLIQSNGDQRKESNVIVIDDSDSDNENNKNHDDDDDEELTLEDVENLMHTCKAGASAEVKNSSCKVSVKSESTNSSSTASAKAEETNSSSGKVRNKVDAPLMPPASKCYKKKKTSIDLLEQIIVERSVEALKVIDNCKTNMVASHSTESNVHNKDVLQTNNTDECYILPIEEALIDIPKHFLAHCIKGILDIIREYA